MMRKGKTMNLKNCKYMKTPEFKTRQVWLNFVDAVGIALEIMAEVKEKAADWFSAWRKEFRTPQANKKHGQQLKINFLEWMNIPAYEKT
jgi:hypothetical protein